MTPPPEHAPVYDFNPPRRPRFAHVLTGAGGLVQIPVQAERGSRLIIRNGTRTIATVRATGALQTITFHATTGHHVYRAIATDSAGNRSSVNTVRVRADATPPATRRINLAPGSPEDSRTRYEAVTDSGTTYGLLIDGRSVQHGVTSDGLIDEAVNLANGHHEVALKLRDATGNRRVVKRTFDVKVKTLQVAAQVLSEARDATQVFRIRGTENAMATLRIPGVSPRRIRLTGGAHDVSVALSDGAYDAPVVILVDRHGRRGVARLAPFVVDTAAPPLHASLLEKQAKRGLLTLVLAAERGSHVTWRLTDVSGHVIRAAQYTAQEGPQRVERNVAEGRYNVEVTATDNHGNTSSRRFAARIAADPITPGVVAIAALSLLVLLSLLALVAYLLWRNRRRFSDWQARRRARAAELARQRQHAAAMAAYDASRIQHQAAVQRYHREDTAWKQRRDQLTKLVEIARTETGSAPGDYANLKLKRDEKVYGTVPGGMVDMRSSQGVASPTIVDHGQVTVTTDRVVFNGTKKREWAFDKLDGVRHVGQDQTMLNVSNRRNWSGVTYTDSARTRTYIKLALADMTGSRLRVIDEVESWLQAHEDSRPESPAHLGPPPSEPTPLPLEPRADRTRTVSTPTTPSSS